ncbi:MAG: aspartate--tRNA(Asn) ligase [Candidatus Aenigmarchaeota archaeon]|nr:aspartate--tRNA(Asn) ligase [Candidatus Aenigmarchaeota archaeon]
MESMEKTYSRDVKAGKKVVVSGWVSSTRDLGNIKFFLLRDREGMIQVTAKKGSASDGVRSQIVSLGREDLVSVEGVAVASKQAPGGREIIPEKITVLGKAASPLPIDIGEKIESNLDKRLDWRVLDLRNPKNLAIFKVQDALVGGMTRFLREKGFLQVFTPCLMGAASESGAQVFPVVYFNKEVYLRQDPQLHRELVIAGGFDRVYDLGPSWRAEHSHTSRHLCEHRGLAPEFTLKDEGETMRMEEEMVVAGVKAVKMDCKEELSLLGVKVSVPETPFPELRFPKIYDILEKLGKKIPRGKEYDTESEKLLADWVKKKKGSDFFFVNRFPYKEKPFYVMRVDDEPEWARSVDLVYKGLELSSGGQREHRYDKLIKQVKEKGMNPKSVEWFTKFFKYAVPPLGGFCVGVERLTMQLLDIKNVREAALFPRTPERCFP